MNSEVLAQQTTLTTYAARAVERALTRLAEGTYGRCEAYHGNIPAPRLVALPFATRCLTCQVLHESSAGARFQE